MLTPLSIDTPFKNIPKTRSVFIGFLSKEEKRAFLTTMKKLLPSTIDVKDCGSYYKGKNRKIHEVELEVLDFNGTALLANTISALPAYKKERVLITYVCSEKAQQEIINKIKNKNNES